MKNKEWDKNRFADIITETVKDIVNRAIADGKFDITEQINLVDIVLESMDKAQTIVLDDLETAVTP